jgi:hypothetical protein
VAGRGRRGGVPTAEDGSRGRGQSNVDLQVSERMGQVRGGLSGKSEEGCVWAGVLTGDRGDGGMMAFREADGGGNSVISGGATGAARGCGRGELSGTELRWPLGAAGGFEEEKWREGGGGSWLDDGEARSGKKGGRAGGRQGARPMEACTGRRRVSRGGEGGTHGPCAMPWGSRGKEGAGPAREQQC